MASSSLHEISTGNVTASQKHTSGFIVPHNPLAGPTRLAVGKTTNFRKVSEINIEKKRVLDYKIHGERISPGNWCSGCQNGGRVILCTTCHTNSMCTDCIDVPVDESNLDSIELECPSCFLKKDRKAVYPFRIRESTSTRQYWPTVLTTPLAIISFHLDSMHDTTSISAYDRLQPWLLGNLVHVDFDFNFEAGDNDFRTCLRSMFDRFEDGDLKDWSRFFVFVTTHSDPRTGYLHSAPHNKGSASISKFFDIIFTPRFQKLLKKSDSNILSLMSCGWVSQHRDSKLAITDFANQGFFSRILCFAQTTFQPAFAHDFITAIGLQNFVYRRMRMELILREQQELGAHTDVIEFQKGKISTFRWTHPGARPMGVPVTKQCRSCHRLKTMAPIVSQDGLKITLRCSECRAEQIYDFPSGWKWVSYPPVKGDERGAWIVRVDETEFGI